MFNDLLQGQAVQIDSLEGQIDLPLGVAQHSQGGGSLRQLVLRNDGNAGAPVALPCGAGGLALGQLVLQFQNHPLGNLFADALGTGEGFFVPGDDRQRQIRRSAGRLNGQRRLGAHSGD